MNSGQTIAATTVAIVRSLKFRDVVAALVLFAVAVAAVPVFGPRLWTVIRGPRSATAAEILASVRSGDSHEWFELTEQPEPALTTQFQYRVKGEIRVATVHLMRARSAPGIPISTLEANPKAPIDVWTCNLAEINDDYGRGFAAAIKQANPPMLEPFMLCQSENTRATTRLTALYLVLWSLLAAVLVGSRLSGRRPW